MKLYYEEYILTLCLKGISPIYNYRILYDRLFYNNEYKKSETILDISNYKELFEHYVRNILNNDFWFLDYYQKFLCNKLLCREMITNKKITKNNFLYLSLIKKDKVMEIDDIKLEDLKKRLSLKEYITFCNDNSIKDMYN